MRVVEMVGGSLVRLKWVYDTNRRNGCIISRISKRAWCSCRENWPWGRASTVTSISPRIDDPLYPLRGMYKHEGASLPCACQRRRQNVDPHRSDAFSLPAQLLRRIQN